MASVTTGAVANGLTLFSNPNMVVKESFKVSRGFSMALFTLQILLAAALVFKGEYGDSTAPVAFRPGYDQRCLKNESFGCVPQQYNPEDVNSVSLSQFYSMFQDVHVMIFIGFGFLMTFLRRYGFGAVGFNFLIASYVGQLAIVVRGLVQENFARIQISISELISADFCAGAVLISFGAVLGKTSPQQLILMATIEVVLYSINEYIGVNIVQAGDIGGSIFIHTFGAYFGLAVARVLYREGAIDNAKEGSVYHSDFFSMIGTIFLWLYWPSFNAVVAAHESQQWTEQHRAVVNTYLSIAASCVVAFAVSPLVNDNKYDMVHIQNATLAGGVAVGAVADHPIQPVGAVVLGIVAGVVSVMGYRFLTPALTNLKLHDTCGVNNLHGMPGLIAAVASIICAATSTRTRYKESLCQILPSRCNETNWMLDALTPAQQATRQAAALGLTLVIAIVGGIVTGFILKIRFVGSLEDEGLFEDDACFTLPDDAAEATDGDYHNYVSPSNAKLSMAMPRVGPGAVARPSVAFAATHSEIESHRTVSEETTAQNSSLSQPAEPEHGTIVV